MKSNYISPCIIHSKGHQINKENNNEVGKKILNVSAALDSNTLYSMCLNESSSNFMFHLIQHGESPKDAKNEIQQPKHEERKESNNGQNAELKANEEITNKKEKNEISQILTNCQTCKNNNSPNLYLKSKLDTISPLKIYFNRLKEYSILNKV